MSYIGAWLSLVERTVRDREVARSNRVAPTIIKPQRLLTRAAFFVRSDGYGTTDFHG